MLIFEFGAFCRPAVFGIVPLLISFLKLLFLLKLQACSNRGMMLLVAYEVQGNWSIHSPPTNNSLSLIVLLITLVKRAKYSFCPFKIMQ